MSKIYPEILDKKRQEIFYRLIYFKKYGYLAGGTALALQLRHRKSADFDVFIKSPVGNYLRLKTKEIFGRSDFYVSNQDQISFKTKDMIDITFFWYCYKPLYPLVETSSISLASVYDIAADKAHTIGRRAMWRDYVDLFFLLKEEVVNLKKVVGLAKKKFAGEFNEALFLEQLSYFEDMEESPMEFIRDKYSAAEIQSFLEEQVRGYLKTLKLG
ncbi:nucleotidyl transferase AbiEii/AbiGii toxin family protein [Candidatus Shapirobacteria bacterium]|nr:nucleotidyl transferase AbiEii/AbiGii toxin family protein [Chloroflexota bacterium]MBM3208890.1 nucleotidyl transferase AbiEii/AbiGii toxin family protein [Candidatus Shapirobacteria bacterium]